MITTKSSSKGQVVIPKPIREANGIEVVAINQNFWKDYFSKINTYTCLFIYAHKNVTSCCVITYASCPEKPGGLPYLSKISFLDWTKFLPALNT